VVSEEKILEIDQSETRIACGGHVCLWKTNILRRTSLCIRRLLINGNAFFSTQNSCCLERQKGTVKPGNFRGSFIFAIFAVTLEAQK
jgi:hypothetical protein